MPLTFVCYFEEIRVYCHFLNRYFTNKFVYLTNGFFNAVHLIKCPVTNETIRLLLFIS